MPVRQDSKGWRVDKKPQRITKAMDVQRLLREEVSKGEEVDERCLACREVHGSPRLFRMPDGRIVSSYSEEYRMYTEAKWVLKRYKVKRTRQLYLAEVAKMRGRAAYDSLRVAMMEIWKVENELSKVQE